jgi:3-oxoadipate enol-lactonase
MHLFWWMIPCGGVAFNMTDRQLSRPSEKFLTTKMDPIAGADHDCFNGTTLEQNAPSGAFNTSDGCTVSYTLRVAREPSEHRLALIHSLALDGSIWNPVVRALVGRVDVLTYDCRGHGRSGRPVIPYTIELFARDLSELLDHVGWPTATIAGCSLGGGVTQAFGALYPSRTRAIGLIDTTAWYGEDAPLKWAERVAAARSKGLGSLIEFQLTRWFGDEFRAQHPDVLKDLTRVFLANDPDCYAASCTMLGESDLRPYLPSLSMPVAIVVGEEDYATPVADARRLHEAISQSTFTILPKARHLTPLECPENIASELISLLERT